MINNTLYNSNSTLPTKPGLLTLNAPNMNKVSTPTNFSGAGLGTTQFGNSNTTTSIGNGLVKPNTNPPVNFASVRNFGQTNQNNVGNTATDGTGGTGSASGTGSTGTVNTSGGTGATSTPPTGGVTGLFPSVASSLYGMAQTSNPEYQNALKQYQTANEALQNLRSQYADESSAIGNMPGGLNLQGGNQALLQLKEAQKEAALTGEMTASQAAAQTATGQQATQQTGLGVAGGLTQPQQAGPTNVPFNPAEGTYGNPAVGVFGENGLQGIGNISGQINVGQTVAQQNAFLGSAQATGGNLQKLISDNNINPSAFTPFNGALQLGAKYTSNTAYQEFAGQVSDFVNKIAPILGGAAGATTDYKTQLAGQILNSWANGQSISDVIQYFLNQASQNIQGYSAGGGAGVGSYNPSNGTGQYNW